MDLILHAHSVSCSADVFRFAFLMFLMFVLLPSVSAGDAGRGREEERREETISEEQDGEFRPQTGRDVMMQKHS